jgi:hypothetical protein
MAELNWSMDPNPLDNWICSNRYKQTAKKTCTDSKNVNVEA